MHLFGHNFDHDYYFELPDEGERDTQSISRCSTSHHRDFRVVPRANRTCSTADSIGVSLLLRARLRLHQGECVPVVSWDDDISCPSLLCLRGRVRTEAGQARLCQPLPSVQRNRTVCPVDEARHGRRRTQDSGRNERSAETGDARPSLPQGWVTGTQRVFLCNPTVRHAGSSLRDNKPSHGFIGRLHQSTSSRITRPARSYAMAYFASVLLKGDRSTT